jgi:hypothetical protein
MLKSYFASSKRWLIPGILGVFAMIAPVTRAASSAMDNANNYTPGTFTNGSNGGTGFAPWQFSVSDNSIVGLTNSTVGGGDINSTNGFSFYFYGGPAGSYGEATRNLSSPMIEGDELSFTISYDWENGNRGLDVYNEFGNQLLNINYSGGSTLNLTFSGSSAVNITTDYIENTVVDVVIKQIAGNQLDVTITRVNDGYTTNLVSSTLSSPAARVKFYNGGHDASSLNYALFVNDLELIESTIPAIGLSGHDAMAVGMTNSLIVTRGGIVNSNISVIISNSDPLVADVPADVDFNSGDTTTNFPIAGLSLGSANIEVTAESFPTSLLSVAVYDIGYDDSSYASVANAFTNGGNSGLGFQPWILQNNDGAGTGFTNFAGVFIGDSMLGGPDVNASSGDAFALYANGQGGGLPFVNAIRPFNHELAIGEVISVEIGVNFRNGSKGVALQNSGNPVFEVGAYNDDYFIKYGGFDPVSLGWAYASDSAIVVEFKRVAAEWYDITISREGSAPENYPLGLVYLGPVAPNEVRFFNFNTDSGDSANNLYFNRLALYSGYERPQVSVVVNDGMVVGRTNMFTLNRTGPLDDALDVTINNSDTNVASIPASVLIPAGTNRVEFPVIAISNGFAQFSSDVSGTINFSAVFDVFDIAYDDTTYYPPADFATAGNGGYGFQPWVISGNNGPGDGFTNFVGGFLGDATAGGINEVLNGTDGESFALYANGDGTGTNAPQIEASRDFTALGIGESITFKLGANFRNGAKGVMFQAGGTWLFEFSVFNNDYWYNIRGAGDNPVSLGWSYLSSSVIEVTLSRTGANTYNVDFFRENSPEDSLLVQGITLSQPPDRVRFYVYDTDSGDQNNLYFNDLTIYTGIIGQSITDGIPNSWWELYNIPVIDRVAAADFDNDGYSNLNEYIADTNPNDITSFFPNAILAQTGGNVMNLQTGPTTNSRVYDIWWSTNLLSNPQQWTRYGLNVPGNAGGSNITLQVTNNVSFRIYRTGVALP